MPICAKLGLVSPGGGVCTTPGCVAGPCARWAAVSAMTAGEALAVALRVMKSIAASAGIWPPVEPDTDCAKRRALSWMPTGLSPATTACWILRNSSTKYLLPLMTLPISTSRASCGVGAAGGTGGTAVPPAAGAEGAAAAGGVVGSAGALGAALPSICWSTTWLAFFRPSSSCFWILVFFLAMFSHPLRGYRLSIYICKTVLEGIELLSIYIQPCQAFSHIKIAYQRGMSSGEVG